MEYLSHIMGCHDVWIDSKKIQSMNDWSCPKTLKRLKGFLGLTRYYKKFVRNYGKIVGPLTRLLKKNPFTWNDPTKQAFISLNNSMCLTLVLTVPNFNNPFVLECDVSSIGVGEVLTQDRKALTFTSKQLCDHNLGKSTYDKDMMTILHVVDTRRLDLLRHHFQIKLAHHNLKYFLEQWLSSPKQQKWVTKMLGYDYEIIYNKGKDNVVANVLSHQHEDEGSLLSLLAPIPD